MALCVLLSFIVFYSVSGTKLPNYPMPCYSFGAIVLGYFIIQAMNGNIRTKIYPFIILLVINVALPVGLYFGIKNEIETKGYENNALILVILILAAISSIILYRKKNFRTAVISLMAFYILFNIVFFNYLYPVIYKNNPLSKTIDTIKKYDKVIAYKIFHPSFTYYLPNRVTVFNEADSLKKYLSLNKALVITRESFLPELESMKLDTVAIHHDLFENSTSALLTNENK
jgi:4-amino-4-deoxy-L-arabinose transferase-like glycosyltransferase